jgi:hypothetical protein
MKNITAGSFYVHKDSGVLFRICALMGIPEIIHPEPKSLD